MGKGVGVGPEARGNPLAEIFPLVISLVSPLPRCFFRILLIF
jgi:hypothetical protein